MKSHSGLSFKLRARIVKASAPMRELGMTEQTDILDHLATRLKEARTAQGLSLEAVAKLSGVSRSMVSQIERGESSPTIATLWNLTRALQVDFAGLLESNSAKPTIDVTRAEATPMIEQRGAGCRIRILSPPEDAGRFEVYELTFDANGVLDSQPHANGAREALTVLEGVLLVQSGDAREQLSAGDTARYAADVSHRISAPVQPAKAFLIVQGG